MNKFLAGEYTLLCARGRKGMRGTVTYKLYLDVKNS